ncbi:uncharacterized protein LOC129581849 [Paramacrobiotus metropolitanus]|uniref:uncharacterized protein LOC129581849 n=1 Tax=Paramacrobiotus metropolitanus TaxID=2943436 RepID=UPI002446030C|nr:uncharacterized protein LOC129581849 [Paramacrobiotus metropolitanus]
MANPGSVASAPGIAEPQELIHRARMLADKLRSRDDMVTSLLMKARALEKREEVTGEFHNALVSLNKLTVHASTDRSAVIRDLREESRIIKGLRQENDALCEAAQENSAVIEYIMKKYRQHVKKLALIRQQETLYPALLSQAIANGGTAKEHAEDLEEMICISQHAVKVDTESSRKRMEFLQGIEQENSALRHALNTSKRYAPQLNSSAQTEEASQGRPSV